MSARPGKEPKPHVRSPCRLGSNGHAIPPKLCAALVLALTRLTLELSRATKWLRLERLVRRPHAELASDLATAQPLSRTVQQVRPNGLRLALAGAEGRIVDSRGPELSQRPVRSRLGRSNLAESRACPKPWCCRADCRCLYRACEVQTLRISDELQISWNPATTVRETRPNT